MRRAGVERASTDADEVAAVITTPTRHKSKNDLAGRVGQDLWRWSR
jgi:hypothetical protein